MPTTETLIWDCPECCDSSSGDGPCSLEGKTLYASGLISGTFVPVGGGFHTFEKITIVSGRWCRLVISVSCDVNSEGPDPLYVSWAYQDGTIPQGPTCTAGGGGSSQDSSVNFISLNPILFTVTPSGSSLPSCCPSGTVTVSE